MKTPTRSCPTYELPEEPLFTHSITPARCEALQAHNYHKCGKCVFRSRHARVFESIHHGVRQTAG